MFCKYCGKEIKNDAQFCPYCGGKQGHEAAEPIARKASSGPGQMTEVIDFGEEQFEEDEYPPYDTVTVVKLGGRWVLYISLFVSDPDCRIAALTADAPTGPFEFRDEVIDSRREGVWNAIDPYVLSVDGRVWMFFGSLADGIHRIELSADGLSVKPGAKPAHVAGVRRPADKMKYAWEGSYLHFRKGWWYLFASGGHYGDHTYYLTVGRSRRIDGEFSDSQGRPMTKGLAEPILFSDEGDFFDGPGHNGEIFTSADGRDYIFYHAHARSFKPSERPTLLQELLWSEDGWPRFKDDRPQKTVRKPVGWGTRPAVDND